MAEKGVCPGIIGLYKLVKNSLLTLIMIVNGAFLDAGGSGNVPNRYGAVALCAELCQRFAGDPFPGVHNHSPQ